MKTLMLIVGVCLLASCSTSKRLARVEEVREHESWTSEDRIGIGLSFPSSAVAPETFRTTSLRSPVADARGGGTFTGVDLRVGGDSLSWLDAESLARWSVPSQLVSSLTFASSGQGAFEGLGLGALIGGGVGIVAAAIIVGREEGPSAEAGLAYLYLGGGGIALGAVTGLVVGAFLGAEQQYEIARVGE
jgi:hypothetical protein